MRKTTVSSPEFSNMADRVLEVYELKGREVTTNACQYQYISAQYVSSPVDVLAYFRNESTLDIKTKSKLDE